MKIRPLVIDDKAISKVRSVLMHARQQANWYLIGPDGRAGTPPPGDDPRHEVNFPYGYRAVFSITSHPKDGLLRHLSVSVNTNKPGLYPGVDAVWMIAREFGFTGPSPTEVIAKKLEPDSSSWMFDIHKSEHCIVVAQRVREKDLAE